jgi:homoserine kinase
VRARAPGSSANLGPGFDAVALALSLHVEVHVSPAPRLVVRAEGEGAELPADASHLAARVVAEVAGHDRFEIAVRSAIPVARGLGSSAALAVAAAAAAGAPEPFAVAARFEGHPENAAASAYGGLVAATAAPGGRTLARRLPLDDRLRFVLLVPDRALPTEAARAVLARTVPLADAAANLGALALLCAGLARVEELVPEAGADRLHQDRRAELFPEAPLLLARLREGGAVVSCWSGAGPTLLGICDGPVSAASARDAGEAALAEAGVPGRALEIAPARRGLEVEPR